MSLPLTSAVTTLEILLWMAFDTHFRSFLIHAQQLMCSQKRVSNGIL